VQGSEKNEFVTKNKKATLLCGFLLITGGPDGTTYCLNINDLQLITATRFFIRATVFGVSGFVGLMVYLPPFGMAHSLNRKSRSFIFLQLQVLSMQISKWKLTMQHIATT
jgi:hypothetical protein